MGRARGDHLRMAAECGLARCAGMDEDGQGRMQVGKTIPNFRAGERRVVIDGHCVKV